MTKYRVICLSVMGKNGKIHRLNDEVTERNFFEGAVPALLKDGFIEAIDGQPMQQPAAVNSEPDNVPRGTPEPPDNVENAESDGTKEQPGTENLPIDLEEKHEGGEPTQHESTIPTELPSIEEIKVKEIKAILKEKGVEFESTDNKEELYEKLKTAYNA